jgi:glycosyltransferase involved in cell wall biosynthesis
MSKPKVTVLMSVYNCERYLKKAVDSILNQTFRDFDFLIINDGSSDSTVEILKDYNDPRIKIIDNKKNLGLTRSLNKGLRLAKGEYIARQDADDISLPQRLEKQTEFLSSNPRTAVVGSWTEVIDEYDETKGIWRNITQPHLLKWRLLFSNQFAHCAIMFRKSAVKDIGGYSVELNSAQDYDLWLRISFSWEVANIPEVLVKWRQWGKNISTIHRNYQHEIAKKISRRNLEYILDENIDEFTFKSLGLLYYLSDDQLDFEHIKILTYYLKKLIYKFLDKFDYSNREIVMDLKNEVSTLLLPLLEHNVYEIRYKIIFPLFRLIKINRKVPKKQALRILIKSFIGERIFSIVTNKYNS